MKSYLNSRQFEILSALLREDNLKTISEFSRILNLKPRIIQYNLNAVDCWLSNNGIPFIRHSGVGIYIDLPINKKKLLLDQLSGLVNIELILSSQERRRLLAIKLLISVEHLPSSKLAGEFCVTKTTLLKDLIFLEAIFRKNNLSLEHIPKRGYGVEGHRSHRRFFTCITFCEDHFNNKIPLNNLEDIFPTRLPFRYLWNQESFHADYEFIKKTINRIEVLLNEKFSQAGYTFIFYYLLILLNDIRSDRQISDINIEGFRAPKELLLVNLIRPSLEEYALRSITDSEIQLLILHCHCLPKLIQFNKIKELSEDETLSVQFSNQLNNLCRKLVKEISLYLNPYLYIDEIFQKGIYNFFKKSTLYRKYGFTLLFPIENEIHLLEIDTFKIIKRIVHKNTRLIKLDDHEICALTSIVISNLNRINRNLQKNLKVLLINNGNDSIASIMRDRIIDNFPWFNIINIIRPIDIQQEQLKKANLVITTDEISFEKLPPTIIVTPIITDFDIRQIQNWVTENTRLISKTNTESENLGIVELLEKGNIRFVEKVDSWEDAVRLAGKPLVNKRAIDKSYLEAIIQANIAHGPYSVVAPHIALLHAMPTAGVSELCVGLLIINQGIQFGTEKYDPVHLLFIIGLPRVLSHFNMLNDLVKLIRKKGICEKLLKCNSVKDVQISIQSELIN
ncbi:MAG: PTS sugar transporter subunit IIA [Pelolinea sp.]|nr:PTS sugar transporter subunit IIA [Pelolinea sp.]